MKFPFFKNSNIAPKGLKDELRPSEEFLRSGKQQFLAAYDASDFVARSPAPQSAFAMGIKFGIGVLAVIAVVAGASAYADTTNVPVQSPLYPLKRLGENVQLALTPTSGKAQVQATFAVRRADEIKDLQVTNPTSTLIPSLTSDLTADVSSSLADVAAAEITTTENINTTTVSATVGAVSSTITTTTSSTTIITGITGTTTATSTKTDIYDDVHATVSSNPLGSLCVALSGKSDLDLLGKNLLARLTTECDSNFPSVTSTASSSPTISAPTHIHGLHSSSTVFSASTTTTSTDTSSSVTISSSISGNASGAVRIPSLASHTQKFFDGFPF